MVVSTRRSHSRFERLGCGRVSGREGSKNFAREEKEGGETRDEALFCLREETRSDMGVTLRSFFFSQTSSSHSPLFPSSFRRPGVYFRRRRCGDGGKRAASTDLPPEFYVSKRVIALVARLPRPSQRFSIVVWHSRKADSGKKRRKPRERERERESVADTRRSFLRAYVIENLLATRVSSDRLSGSS